MSPTNLPVSATNLLTFQPPLSLEAVAKWELGVSLIFHNWSVLTDAVVGQWGGPDSDDKRDWLCGAIADMFAEREETDEYDLEDTLVHAMEDEFMVNLEDDSAWQVMVFDIKPRKFLGSGRLTFNNRFLGKLLPCERKYSKGTFLQ